MSTETEPTTDYTVIERERAAFITLIDGLLDTYRPEGVLIWLNSRNRTLDMRRPVDLISAGQWDELHDHADQLAGAPVEEHRPRTDGDMAKAIVALSKAMDPKRLTIGYAATLFADLLAEQRAAIHTQYEQLAAWADKQADSRYRAMAERIRKVARS